MYYEEKVINGILCHRETPDGEWIPFTLETLTIALIAMRNCYEGAKERLEHLQDNLDEVAKAIKS